MDTMSCYTFEIPDDDNVDKCDCDGNDDEYITYNSSSVVWLDTPQVQHEFLNTLL